MRSHMRARRSSTLSVKRREVIGHILNRPRLVLWTDPPTVLPQPKGRNLEPPTPRPANRRHRSPFFGLSGPSQLINSTCGGVCFPFLPQIRRAEFKLLYSASKSLALESLYSYRSQPTLCVVVPRRSLDRHLLKPRRV